jgi:uncharacterized protein (TIGR02246 family)
MKPYLLFPLATLAIGLAAPVLAQQKETIVDAQTVQQLHAIGSKSDEAFKKGDAAARAALFTEDAILLGPTGPIKGRQAIEKYYTDLFQKVHFIENVTRYDKDSPHAIGSSGKDVWESGEWSCTIQDQNGVSKELKGYWCSVKVREGDTWKIRLSTNIPAAVAAATPSTTKSSN